jgi:hypothetical protein
VRRGHCVTSLALRHARRQRGYSPAKDSRVWCPPLKNRGARHRCTRPMTCVVLTSQRIGRTKRLRAYNSTVSGNRSSVIRSSLSFVASTCSRGCRSRTRADRLHAHGCACSIGRDDVNAFPATIASNIATAGALRVRVLADTTLGSRNWCFVQPMTLHDSRATRSGRQIEGLGTHNSTVSGNGSGLIGWSVRLVASACSRGCRSRMRADRPTAHRCACPIDRERIALTQLMLCAADDAAWSTSRMPKAGQNVCAFSPQLCLETDQA